MKVTIFLMCYNEEWLLPKTIHHYKTRFPSCSIVIVDNLSSDRSLAIATSLGCEIRQFESGDQQNEEVMMRIRNSIWTDVTSGWIIMADMDEWLDITEQQLQDEDQKGTTIITTKGYEMIGDSTKEDCSDIDLFTLQKGVHDPNFSKRVLFKVPDVQINYWYGAHQCFPQGNIVYSEKEYPLKHMNRLGVVYLTKKHQVRYDRNHLSRANGMNGHYTVNTQQIQQDYDALSKQAITVPSMF